MEKLKEILRKNNMSVRPEYYSGRGATTSDLDSNLLFSIQKDIREQFGEKPAKEFAKMIYGINVLSATAFLNELYSLFYNNWKYIKTKETATKHIAVGKDKNGNYDAERGAFGVMEYIFSSNRDQTQEIKSYFLFKNGFKQKKVIFDNFYNETKYY